MYIQMYIYMCNMYIYIYIHMYIYIMYMYIYIYMYTHICIHTSLLCYLSTACTCFSAQAGGGRGRAVHPAAPRTGAGVARVAGVAWVEPHSQQTGGLIWLWVKNSLVNGTKDSNLRSPGGVILTHTHIMNHSCQEEMTTHSFDKGCFANIARWDLLMGTLSINLVWRFLCTLEQPVLLIWVTCRAQLKMGQSLRLWRSQWVVGRM